MKVDDFEQLPMNSENFTFSEFESSAIARKNKIRNNCLPRYYSNWKRLLYTTLQPARTMLGLPIHINSGFRCPKLNQLVGGVDNSYHLYGRAVDITSADNERLFDILQTLPHIELIYYEDSNFIHVAL